MIENSSVFVGHAVTNSELKFGGRGGFLGIGNRFLMLSAETQRQWLRGGWLVGRSCTSQSLDQHYYMLESYSKHSSSCETLRIAHHEVLMVQTITLETHAMRLPKITNSLSRTSFFFFADLSGLRHLRVG